MSMNRSELTVSVQAKLSGYDLTLPRSTEIKYLPLTDQLMIYSESKDFNREEAKKIGSLFGNYEIDAVKTGYWRWTNLLFINNFREKGFTNSPENLQIALNTLVTFAVEKEKDRQSADISWAMHEAHFEGTEDETRMLSKELDKIMFSDSKKTVSNARIIEAIKDLKKESKDQQRYQIHTTLSVLNSFEFENKVTPGCVELLLYLLPKIDEEKINYQQLRNVSFNYPKDIKINYYNPQNIPPDKSVYKNGNPNTHFQSYSTTDNLLKVAELNLTVSEFNEKYKDQYTLNKEDERLWKGFWRIADKENKKCGEFMVEGNEIRETPYSKRTYNCMSVIKDTALRKNR